jgi:hypothetical protein
VVAVGDSASAFCGGGGGCSIKCLTKAKSDFTLVSSLGFTVKQNVFKSLTPLYSIGYPPMLLHYWFGLDNSKHPNQDFDAYFLVLVRLDFLLEQLVSSWMYILQLSVLPKMSRKIESMHRH